MGNSSYFRVDDDDDKNKYIYSLNHKVNWVNWKQTAPSIV